MEIQWRKFVADTEPVLALLRQILRASTSLVRVRWAIKDATWNQMRSSAERNAEKRQERRQQRLARTERGVPRDPTAVDAVGAATALDDKRSPDAQVESSSSSSSSCSPVDAQLRAEEKELSWTVQNLVAEYWRASSLFLESAPDTFRGSAEVTAFSVEEDGSGADALLAAWRHATLEHKLDLLLLNAVARMQG